ncbi:MAG TPA: hypothetical protein VJL81_00490 [Solirubrobacterales bacterium]|nr:hypothetical protein [Solirubrobacterales bacterium]
MRRPRLTYANVVSTICLFLLLGGATWAATALPKNSVGTPQLKNGAVTGAKVKDGSLTGTDIKASTLGQVPSAATAGTATSAAHATGADTATRAGSAASADHATSADTAARAGDAATLDGLGPAAFVPAADLQSISYEAHWESELSGPQRTLLALGPMNLSAVCFDSELGGTHTYLQLLATGPAGSSIDYSLVIGSSAKVGNVLLEPAAPTEVQKIFSENPGSINASMTLVYRDSSRTISIPLAIFVAGNSDVCRVTGSAIAAE